MDQPLDPAVAGRSLWRSPGLRRLVLLTLLGFSSFFLLLGSAASWAHTGGAGEGAAGLVTTVLLGCTVAVQGVVPALLRRFGIGTVLVAGMLALGAAAPLYGVSADLPLLLCVSAVRGFGFAVLTVVGVTLTAVVAPPERRGESIGLYGLGIAVPNLFCVPAGVALTQAGHFPVVALLGAAPVLGIPLALSLGRAAELTDAHRPSGPAQVRSSWRTAARVAAPSLVLLTVTLAAGGLVTFVPISRPTGATAPVALLVFGASSALCRWRVGVFADRVGSPNLLPATLLTAVAGITIVAVGLRPGANSVVAYFGALLFGAGYGCVQNLTLVDALARAGRTSITIASATWNAAFDAGTASGAVAVGILAETGIGLPGALSLTGMLMAFALPLAAARGDRPEAA